MSTHGPLVEVTVVGCKGLKKAGWISKLDRYVVLEYGSAKHRTLTSCVGQDPTFNEKFHLPYIEGLLEMNVSVWNKDVVIGSGIVRLHNVCATGFHDSSWPLETRNGRRAGEIRVILHRECPAQQGLPVQPQSPAWQPSSSQVQYYPPAHGPCPPPQGPYPPPNGFYSYSGHHGYEAPYYTSVQFPYPTGAPPPYPQGYPPSGYPRQGFAQLSAPMAPPTGGYYPS